MFTCSRSARGTGLACSFLGGFGDRQFDTIERMLHEKARSVCELNENLALTMTAHAFYNLSPEHLGCA